MNNEIEKFAPREWQTKCFDEFQEIRQTQKDFLICACPGAGKTKMALYIAQQLMNVKEIEQLIVVTPSESLKVQWAEEAHEFFGIELDPSWTNRDFNINGDYDGICVTFNAVAREPLIHRRLCQHRTLVILDEIHHAADESSWGESIRQGFEAAAFRLGLSGTPFRSDEQAIPFVSYGDDNRCKPDHQYSYATGLRDGIVADVVFPKHDGKMVWIDEDGVQSYGFKDELASKDAARRLRTALDSNGEWLRTVLKASNDDLTRVRSNPNSPHPEAGGLILAIDKIQIGRAHV